MFRLSGLPLEILYYIGQYIPTEDLITLGRLNVWYSYWVSSLIADRIKQDVQKDGWRIHIDILSTSHPKDNVISGGFPFSSEVLLLSEFVRINPITLGLEFKLCPLEENGFDSKISALPGESSVIIFDKINTNINILAYFTQISTNVDARRLEYINQAGASVVNANTLVEDMKKRSSTDGVINMGIEFNVEYGMAPITKESERDQSLDEKIQTFKVAYHRHKIADNNDGLTDSSSLLKNPSVIMFKTILVSSDWWVQQMKNPPIEQNFFEFVLW